MTGDSNEKHLTFSGKTYRVSGEGAYFQRVNENSMRALLAVARVLPDNFDFIDVGANIGIASIASVASGAGRGFAFEPIPRTIDFLRGNLKMNGIVNVEVVPFGAGRQSGVVEFRDIPEFASGNHRVLENSEFSRTLVMAAAPVVALDAFAERAGLAKLELLKIDVEGFELDVLGGSENILEAFSPICLLEFNHWCLTVMAELNPLFVLRELMTRFSSVGYFLKEEDAFRPLVTDKDVLDFLRRNLLQTHVDDLVLSNNDLVQNLWR